MSSTIPKFTKFNLIAQLSHCQIAQLLHCRIVYLRPIQYLSKMKLNLKRPIVFFDLETTGTDTAKDRIVELAFVKINTDGSRDKYVKRINPQMPIPAESSAIHGIYDCLLYTSRCV